MTAFNTVTEEYSRGLLDITPAPGTRVPKKAVQCDVVFGAPSSGCQGTGICKIAAREERALRTRNCRHALAYAAQGAGGNGISIFFFRENLCSRLMRLHFRHGVLTVTEPCRLPKYLITQLDLNISVIPVGRYRLEEAFGYYRLNLS